MTAIAAPAIGPEIRPDDAENRPLNRQTESRWLAICSLAGITHSKFTRGCETKVSHEKAGDGFGGHTVCVVLSHSVPDSPPPEIPNSHHFSFASYLPNR